jgi:hypothetical protein
MPPREVIEVTIDKLGEGRCGLPLTGNDRQAQRSESEADRTE